MYMYVEIIWFIDLNMSMQLIYFYLFIIIYSFIYLFICLFII